MVKFVEQNWTKYNPKAKLRLEVLFKKFLATRFWTKSYLLNKIKPFSGYETSSLTKSQKLLQGGTLRNLDFKIPSMQDIKMA
jgi:hypothetical protein